MYIYVYKCVESYRVRSHWRTNVVHHKPLLLLFFFFFLFRVKALRKVLQNKRTSTCNTRFNAWHSREQISTSLVSRKVSLFFFFFLLVYTKKWVRMREIKREREREWERKREREGWKKKIARQRWRVRETKRVRKVQLKLLLYKDTINEKPR